MIIWVLADDQGMKNVQEAGLMGHGAHQLGRVSRRILTWCGRGQVWGAVGVGRKASVWSLEGAGLKGESGPGVGKEGHRGRVGCRAVQ